MRRWRRRRWCCRMRSSERASERPQGARIPRASEASENTCLVERSETTCAAGKDPSSDRREREYLPRRAKREYQRRRHEAVVARPSIAFVGRSANVACKGCPAAVVIGLGRESMPSWTGARMIARVGNLPRAAYGSPRTIERSEGNSLGCKFSENARTSRRSGEERRRAQGEFAIR